MHRTEIDWATGTVHTRKLRNGAPRGFELRPIGQSLYLTADRKQLVVIETMLVDVSRYNGAALRELRRRYGDGKPKKGSPAYHAWQERKARARRGERVN